MNAIAKTLVSSFARFVQGDIKGGEHAHAYRKEIIASAIEQAYKGNYSPITEAQTLTEGKAKKARAYAAGFAALGVIGDADGIKKVDYKGALNANENKAAREEIANKTAASTTAFFAAFDVVMAEKAEPKAKKATASAPAAPTGDAASAPELSAEELQRMGAIAIDASVSAMENALLTNALTGEQVDRVMLAAVQALTVDQLNEYALLLGRAAQKANERETATA